MQPNESSAELNEASPGVFYTDAPYLAWNDRYLERLRESAQKSPRRRSRICLHSGSEDVLHEMLIYVLSDVYIRPHRHFKPESLHIMGGSAEIIVFDESGQVQQVLDLGTEPQQVPFVRFTKPIYHTVRVLQGAAILHEVTRGPLRAEETQFAPWAPDETSTDDVAVFQSDLHRRIQDWLVKRGQPSGSSA